jgi:hypothetical protein
MNRQMNEELGGGWMDGRRNRNNYLGDSDILAAVTIKM